MRGVCVAGDTALWRNPDFLQVVFWGPEGVALGGMHLLVVAEGDRRFVTLPGINPSLALLDQVAAADVLDCAVDYAWRLARTWGCDGVWVPTATWITPTAATCTSPWRRARGPSGARRSTRSARARTATRSWRSSTCPSPRC
ncbi:MAG: hypothetical protein R3F59_19965 [Myxococcota bacterium]